MSRSKQPGRWRIWLSTTLTKQPSQPPAPPRPWCGCWAAAARVRRSVHPGVWRIWLSKLHRHPTLYHPHNPHACALLQSGCTVFLYSLKQAPGIKCHRVVQCCKIRNSLSSRSSSSPEPTGAYPPSTHLPGAGHSSGALSCQARQGQAVAQWSAQLPGTNCSTWQRTAHVSPVSAPARPGGCSEGAGPACPHMLGPA